MAGISQADRLPSAGQEVKTPVTSGTVIKSQFGDVGLGLGNSILRLLPCFKHLKILISSSIYGNNIGDSLMGS